MRWFIITIVCLFSLFSYSQGTWSYRTVYIPSTNVYWNVAVWRLNPFSVKTPGIVVMPGTGETGTNINSFINSVNYPGWQLNNGWNGIALGYEITYIFIQSQTTTAYEGAVIARAINDVITPMQDSLDMNMLYLTGISRGAGQEMLSLRNDITPTIWNNISGYWGLSVGFNSATFNNTRYGPWAYAGGRALLSIGTADTTTYNATMNFYRYMNATVAGSALLYLIPGGGHGGWQLEYNPATKRWNGMNGYENLMTYSKKPYAAVPNSIVYLPAGTTSYALTGIISEYPTGKNGWSVSSLWAKTGGGGTIVSPSSVNTTVNGLTPGNNTFTFSRNNADGQTATANLTIIVSSGAGALFRIPKGAKVSIK